MDELEAYLEDSVSSDPNMNALEFWTTDSAQTSYPSRLLASRNASLLGSCATSTSSERVCVLAGWNFACKEHRRMLWGMSIRRVMNACVPYLVLRSVLRDPTLKAVYLCLLKNYHITNQGYSRK